jgi:hypothetical protein
MIMLLGNTTHMVMCQTLLGPIPARDFLPKEARRLIRYFGYDGHQNVYDLTCTGLFGCKLSHFFIKNPKNRNLQMYLRLADLFCLVPPK